MVLSFTSIFQLISMVYWINWKFVWSYQPSYWKVCHLPLAVRGGPQFKHSRFFVCLFVCFYFYFLFVSFLFCFVFCFVLFCFLLCVMCVCGGEGEFVNAWKRGRVCVISREMRKHLQTRTSSFSCYAQEIANSIKTCLKQVHLWRGMDTSTVGSLVSNVCEGGPRCVD